MRACDGTWKRLVPLANLRFRISLATATVHDNIHHGTHQNDRLAGSWRLLVYRRCRRAPRGARRNMVDEVCEGHYGSGQCYS